MIGFYFDEMLIREAALQLAQRGYTVTMAVDVGMVKKFVCPVRRTILAVSCPYSLNLPKHTLPKSSKGMSSGCNLCSWRQAEGK